MERGTSFPVQFFKFFKIQVTVPLLVPKASAQILGQIKKIILAQIHL
jgi:hypothetical protein